MNYKSNENTARKKTASDESLAIQTLWKKYNKEPTEANFNKLFLAYTPLRDRIIHTTLKHPIPSLIEESIAESNKRFPKVLKNYQNSNALFTTFLIHNIQGAALDAQRTEMQRMNGISRQSSERASTLETIQNMQGVKSTHQMALYLINKPKILSASPWKKIEPWTFETLQKEIDQIKTLKISSVSLNEPIRPSGSGEKQNLIDTIPSKHKTPDEETINNEQIGLMIKAVEFLPTNLKMVYQRHAINGETLLEISKDIGVSESRVCQLDKQMKKELKDIMLRLEFEKSMAQQTRPQISTIEISDTGLSDTASNESFKPPLLDFVRRRA